MNSTMGSWETIEITTRHLLLTLNIHFAVQLASLKS